MTPDNTTLDEQIIHLLLTHRESRRTFLDSPVKVAHFQKKYQLLIESILENDGNDAILTRASFRLMVERRAVPKKEALLHENIYNDVIAVIGVKHDDIHALLAKKLANYIDTTTCNLIQKFDKQRAVDPIIAAKELSEKLRGTLDEAEHETHISFDTIESDSFGDQYERELQEKRTKEQMLITCGIPEIDDIMGTGFDAETLSIICADVGSYKSTLMLQIALGVYDTSKCDVLFVPLEMGKNRIYDKIISNKKSILGSTLQKPKGVMTDEQFEAIREFRKEIKEGNSYRFALLEVGERTTVSTIRRQIEKHLTFHKPRLVVIDYIANLLPDRSHYGRNDLEIGDMLKDLLKMGKAGTVSETGFGVLTGAQLGRDALKRLRQQRDSTKFSLSSEDIQGSHQYAADATAIFGLYKIPTDPAHVMIFPIKSRFGAPVYKHNGMNRTNLKVEPEYSRISSILKPPTNHGDLWKSDANELLERVVSVPNMPQENLDLDFEDDVTDTGPKNDPLFDEIFSA